MWLISLRSEQGSSLHDDHIRLVYNPCGGGVQFQRLVRDKMVLGNG